MAIKEASVTSTCTAVTRGPAQLPGCWPLPGPSAMGAREGRKWMDLDADILWRQAVGSQQDPKVQSYCSPLPILTQQHPTRAEEGLCPQQTLLWGWGVREESQLCCPRARNQVDGGRREFASPKSCPFLVAGLAAAPCDVLQRGWKQSSSRQ